MQLPSAKELSYAAIQLRNYREGTPLDARTHAQLHEIGYRLFQASRRVVGANFDGRNPLSNNQFVTPQVALSLLHYNQPRDILNKNLIDLPTLEKELSGLAHIVSTEKH